MSESTQILVFGNYDPDYNRTKTMISGLRKNGFTIKETPFKKKEKPNISKLKELSNKSRWTLFPAFTHNDILKFKKHVSSPIIFDPLVSRYMTKVLDYKNVKKWSPRALKNFLKDKWAMQSADILLSDTHQHKMYYAKKFKIPEKKIVVAPIGVNPDEFYPIHYESGNSFHVGFYGGFIPLQGVLNIITAFNILKNEPDLEFTLIGNGFEFEKAKKLAAQFGLNNLNFKGWIPYQELNNEINKFDLCLGIFGETIKSDYVVPNKIFHYAACKKAILTKDTPAIQEIFDDGKNISLCSNKPEDIAANILRLKQNTEKRNELGVACYNLMMQKYTDEKIAKELTDKLNL